MALRILEGPASEPIALEEAKAHLNVDTDDNNTLIEALITAAREHLEGPLGILCGRTVASQTYELTLEAFPDDDEAITLEFPPLIDVESVEYMEGGSPTYTALTDYQLVRDGQGRATIKAGEDGWPTPAEDPEAVRVVYTAGYETVPAPLRAAMLLMIGELYEQREISVVGLTVTQMPTFDRLIAPYRFFPL